MSEEMTNPKPREEPKETMPEPEPDLWDQLPRVKRILCKEKEHLNKNRPQELVLLAEEIDAEKRFWNLWYEPAKNGSAANGGYSEVTKEILELQCERDELKKMLEALDKGIEAKRAELTRLADNLQQLLSEDLKAVRTEITDLDKQIEQLETKLAELDESEAARKALIQAEIDAAKSRKQSLEQSIVVEPPGLLYQAIKEALSAWRKARSELKKLVVGTYGDCHMGDDTSKDKFGDLEYSQEDLTVSITQIEKEIEYLEKYQQELEAYAPQQPTSPASPAL